MIAENYKRVKENIELSKKKRENIISDAVQLVAVTKYHDVEAMRRAIDAGVDVIGENRVQEAEKKHAVLDRDVRWHLIGHLQTNKVKHAVKIFDMIESVDSVKLAEAIEKEAAKLGKVQDILVQVNLVKEASKTGVYLEDLDELLSCIDDMEHLKLKGLMFIAPIEEDIEMVRPMFNKMYHLFREVQQRPYKTADVKYLSMGMTHDYQIAVEEGANIVRVGTAIFGPRQY